MVYISSLTFMPVVIISFVSSQVAPLMQAYKDHDLYFITCMIPVVIGYMNALSYVDLGMPLPPHNFLRRFHWLACRIYIETGIVVLISYVSLLIVNWSYIWLAVFPVIAIGFIFAVYSEFSPQNGSQHQQGSDGEASVGRKAEGLEAVALVPYWALCVMSHFHADKFAVSQFLLFFSFMLGALTLMMTRLGQTISDRGIVQASELLWKALLVVLLVAVHAVAAELLGENVLLFCLPEIAPVLLWLSLHLDGDGGATITVTADEIELERNVLDLDLLGKVSGAVLALLVNYMDESVMYWCTKAMVSCGVSGLLVYYLVFMLCQWPGQDGTATSFAKEAVRLLRFWANILLTAASASLVFTALQVAVWVLRHEPMVPASGSHILRRMYEKFLEFII